MDIYKPCFMIIKKYTHNRKVVCYIKKHNDTYIVCTGKPSDATCITWQYTTIQEAEFTAQDYYNNRTNFFKP